MHPIFRSKQRVGSDSSTKARLGLVSKSTSPLSTIRTRTKSTIPYRTSLSSRIESLFSTSERRAKHKIKSVVRRIEHMRRHRGTKIFKRYHDDFDNNPDTLKFKKLCIALMEFTSSKHLSSHVQCYASSEVIRLVVGDPAIRTSMQECRFADGIISANVEGSETMICQRRARLSFDDSSLQVHNLWTGLLLLRLSSPPITDEVSRYAQLNYEAFRDSMTDPNFSFLAARYLCCALELLLEENNIRCLVGIWRSYMDEASVNPDAIEWSNFNDCIKALHSSGRPITTFVSPNCLAGFAMQIARYANILPDVFPVFFSRPVLSYTMQSTDIKGHIKNRVIFEKISNPNVDRLSSFCSEFMKSLSFFDTPNFTALFSHPNNIHHTVLASEETRDYFRLVDGALETYRDGLTTHTEVRNVRSIRHWTTDGLSDPDFKDRELQLFLLARYVGIDRYCKRTMWEMKPHPLLLSSSLINNVLSLVGGTKETTLPIFDNVPYLRRFRLRDRFLIASDYLPEPSNLLVEGFTSNVLRDFSVDTLVLAPDAVLWLRIVGHRSLFKATGHYPILAGFGPRGEELYVAAAKVYDVYYFSYVRDGAWTVTYTDEVGKEHKTDKFFVLVLRHDPSDINPPYPRTPSGAVDPTGPLHWLKFWPEKDPDYVAVSDSARDDDDHLQSLLNSFDGKTSACSDIWWWN